MTWLLHRSSLLPFDLSLFHSPYGQQQQIQRANQLLLSARNTKRIVRIPKPRWLASSQLAPCAMSFFSNPFRRAQREEESGQIQIQVRWGRERLNIPIPDANTTPLSSLLATLSQHTSLPISSLKLIFNGAVLKDTSVTLAAYGIKQGSSLVLVGKGGEIPGPEAAATNASSKKAKQPPPTTEPALIDYIERSVDRSTKHLIPTIPPFLQACKAQAEAENAEIPAELQKEHARLSELLLRGLLELDGIEVPSGWQDARKARKDGVRSVQGYLDQVDGAWQQAKRR